MSAPTKQERDYVLGTHDDEVERLAVQHRVWRARALEAWRKAGFGPGQTLLDIGCGPGYATMDLAEIAGPSGRVIAVDRSRRFLDTLEYRRRQRELDNIEALELDLDNAPENALDTSLSAHPIDGAWGRWIFAFVNDPRRVLARIAEAMRPGGVIAVHEYFHYSTWSLMPRSPELEEFVGQVMKSWRRHGGEPDIGRSLPGWLVELGFEIQSLTPMIDIIRPTDFMWQWPKAFIGTGLKRLVDLGDLSVERARAIERALHDSESNPQTRMVTPAVVEIIAKRRSRP